jgi:hypothetical protein
MGRFETAGGAGEPLCRRLTAGWLVFRPAPERVQGEVECREVDVAAKVPGRLAEVLAKKAKR